MTANWASRSGNGGAVGSVVGVTLAAGALPTGAPHSEQNLALLTRLLPHRAQAAGRRAPHSEQNFELTWFSR
jgi:hypothetical protein